MCVYTYIGVCVCVYTYIGVCVCVCVCTYIGVCVCVCVPNAQINCKNEQLFKIFQKLMMETF